MGHGVSMSLNKWRIITEFCEGGTLFELLHEQEDISLTWSAKLKICTDVAAAVDYLHKFPPPIVHRDLKSLNLLLAKKLQSTRDVPVCKVSDFGLARMKDVVQGEWGKMTAGAGTLN